MIQSTQSSSPPLPASASSSAPSNPASQVATTILASTSSDAKSASNIPVTKSLQKINPVTTDSQDFYKVVEKLLSNYGCPMPAALCKLITPFELLYLLYTLILIRACTLAKPASWSAIKDLDLINLYSQVFVQTTWQLNGEDSHSTTSHQKALIELDALFTKFVTQLNLNEKDRLIKDFRLVNQVTSTKPKTEQLKYSWPLEMIFPLILFLGDVVLLASHFLQEAISRQSNRLLKALAAVTDLSQVQSTKNKGRKKTTPHPDILLLNQQTGALKQYLVIRLLQLKKKCQVVTWKESNVIEEVQKFKQLSLLFSTSVAQRCQNVKYAINRMQLALLSASNDNIMIENLLFEIHDDQFYTILIEYGSLLANKTLQLAEEKGLKGTKTHLTVPTQNQRDLFSACLDRLQQAMLSTVDDEKLRLFDEFKAHKESLAQAETSGWYQMIYNFLFEQCEPICEKIHQQVILNQKAIVHETPLAMRDLLQSQSIPSFLQMVKNAVNSCYLKCANDDDYHDLLALQEIAIIMKNSAFGPPFPIHWYQRRVENLSKQAQLLNTNFLTQLNAIAPSSIWVTGSTWVTGLQYMQLQQFAGLLATARKPQIHHIPTFPEALDWLQDELRLLDTYTSTFHVHFTGIFHNTLPLIIDKDIPNNNADWLDEIDAEATVEAPTKDPISHEVDAKETAEAPIVVVAPTSAATFSLPSTLPSQPGEVIDLFKEMVGKFYPIPQPFASPIAAQKLPANTAVLRQQQFAMTCLKSVCELRKLSTAPAQQDLLTSQFFLLEHQALEQGLTHLSPNSSSHRLRTLLADIDLQGNFLSVRENPDATHFFRYPFVHNIAITPLALRHIMESTEKTTATQLNEREWLQDMIKMLTAAMTRHKAANKQEQDFADTMQGLIDHLATTEEEAKASIEKVMPLPTVQSKALQTKATELKEVIEALTKQLRMQPTTGRFSQNKIDTLKACVHHLKCLHVSIDLFKDFPSRKFLFLHAWTQQIAAQYFAENMGVFLSLANHDPYYSHNLMEYCSLYALDDGLLDPQKKTLASINLQKASEYLYKRSPHPTDKVATGKMKWLSSLYEQSTIEEGLSRGTIKTINTAALQQQVYDNCVELVNLVIPLTQTKLIKE